jgi:RNA polymerase sigma-70 factor (sigma-E family)
MPEQSDSPSKDWPSFEAFVEQRSRALWRNAWLLTGDEHKAEDLLQTALLKVWRRWSTINRRAGAEAYARRVLVTTYTDWWRRRWNAELPSDALPELPFAGPPTEVRHDLLTALAGLSRGQRAVVVLRYVEDLSEADTAAILGCSPGTVKSQLSRALAALRTSPALQDESESEGTR